MVPLHKIIIAAMLKRVKEEFVLPELRLSMRDELEDVLKAASPRNRQGAFTALFIDGMDILEGGDTRGAAGGFRQYALSSRGGGVRSHIREPGKPEDGNDGHGGVYDTALRMNLVPIKFNFTFWYGNTDVAELMDFLVDWAFARQKRLLDFKLRYMNVELAIRADLSSSMSVPRKQPDSDSGGYLVYEGQLEVFGYANRDDKRDVHRRPLVVESNLDASLGDSEAQEKVA